MSTMTESFGEAAALFALFARSDWRSCHVRADGIELFVARDRGIANPMTGPAPEPVASAITAELRAPHLGTLLSLARVGTAIAAGEAYGRIELLGETIDLVAEEGGIVADHLLPAGTLAEYDQPLISLH